jgi:diguanylate cyclase (GGDEF)-like protein
MWDKLLLLERSDETRSSVKGALNGVFSVFIEAMDGPDALNAFEREKPGFIIADYDAASPDAGALVSAIRERDEGRDIPIIMLSASDTLERKLGSFSIGANDYLAKPFDSKELLARVRSFLRVRETIDGLKKKNTLLEELVLTDALTCLYNRRHFFEAVREQVAMGLRHNFRVGCLIIDIDHFKDINDTHGHAAGDDIIIKVGGILNSMRREGEILARYGGDEFIICLLNTDEKRALLAAERFMNGIKGHEFRSPHHPPMRLTVSIGAAVFPRNRVTTIDELLKAADSALYRSKAAGRDRITLFDRFADEVKDPGARAS